MYERERERGGGGLSLSLIHVHTRTRTPNFGTETTRYKNHTIRKKYKQNVIMSSLLLFTLYARRRQRDQKLYTTLDGYIHPSTCTFVLFLHVYEQTLPKKATVSVLSLGSRLSSLRAGLSRTGRVKTTRVKQLSKLIICRGDCHCRGGCRSPRSQ